MRGTIEKREIEYILEQMAERKTDQIEIEIDVWSDTGLVRLAPTDDLGQIDKELESIDRDLKVIEKNLGRSSD